MLNLKYFGCSHWLKVVNFNLINKEYLYPCFGSCAFCRVSYGTVQSQKEKSKIILPFFQYGKVKILLNCLIKFFSYFTLNKYYRKSSFFSRVLNLLQKLEEYLALYLPNGARNVIFLSAGSKLTFLASFLRPFCTGY